MGLWDYAKWAVPGYAAYRGIKYATGKLGEESQSATENRENLNAQGAAAGGFADTAQQGYGQMTQESGEARDYLKRLARGEESVSAEQLRQANQQQLAMQRSMAAGAAPQNSAMAARNAARQMGAASMGLAGQQSLAGIAERQAAQQGLANMILQQRQQDIQAALGSRGNAISAYGGVTPEKSWIEKWGQPITGGLSSAATLSDERHKTEIKGGDREAKRAIEGLKAFTYKYKDERNGRGKQFGPMAQDLEKAGLGHAVIDTPRGKYVDGGKAALAGLGLVAALGRRVAKLEGKGK